MEKPTYAELESRIRDQQTRWEFTDLNVACWEGYLAALIEWGLLSPGDHSRLCDMLPNLDPDPTLPIFLGVDGAARLKAESESVATDG